MHPRVIRSGVLLYAAVLMLAECSLGKEPSKRLEPIEAIESVGLKVKSGRRGGRFLGLLGLLTGLTLVDSLDDESDRPRRSGFVKIDVGHPSSLDAFYGAYGYSSPYWTGGSSINIKIPFRPAGSEFETMALLPFPVPFPPTGPAHFGATAATGVIEPRPTIFSDPIPVPANGPGTIAADEVVEQPLSSRKQKLAVRKPAPTYHRSRPLKVSPPRTIRSTVRADELEDPELAPDTTEQTVTEDPQEIGELPTTPAVSNDPTETPTSIPTAPESEEPEPATPASIVESELNYVTQPVIASSYHTHQHSLADVSAIELTTAAGELFLPSRADHWQNYYGSVALDASNRPYGFLPIAPPQAAAGSSREAQ
uniref:DUF4794 domain-containing protein n=1 Tax=Anopheles farauti TaxID=69004 RepID=A0A182Q4N8_9DIPT